MINEGQAAGRGPAGGNGFALFLRTVRRVGVGVGVGFGVEQKFNPWHDPRNGQFTFAGQGVRSGDGGGVEANGGAQSTTASFIRSGGGGRITLGGASAAAVRPASGRTDGNLAGAVRKLPRRGGRRVPIRPLPPASANEGASGPGAGHNLPKAPQPNAPKPELIRPGIGHNGGPPLKDNLPLRALFPALGAGEAAVAIASASVLANPLGPAAALLDSMNRNETARLIKAIQEIDPGYRLQSLVPPQTVQGWTNQFRQLRWDLAVRAYRIRSDHSYLQAETTRFLQARVDARYEEAVRKYDRGELPTRLSREEAIGTHVDRTVRRDLRDQFRRMGIPTERGSTVRVNGREYDTSGTDRTFRIPDARVGSIAIDMTLTPKSLRTPQVRGFFNSDFLPEAVIIVRPSQIGAGSTYIITRPTR